VPEPVIILSHPQLGENIGAIARVMSNFGLTRLRVVAPRDGWPNKSSYELAANGSFILDKASVHDTLLDAITDITYLYGTSAQLRHIVKPSIAPSNLNKDIFLNNTVGFLFGRERSGLNNEELHLCDALISINSSEINPSLNIAQAVAIIAYEYSCLANKPKKLKEYPQLASKEEVSYFFQLLETELDKKDFFRNKDMKPTMIQNLYSTFTRASLTQQDVRTLIGAIKALIR
jgi:tRNA/rRNA methyltransferase